MRWIWCFASQTILLIGSREDFSSLGEEVFPVKGIPTSQLYATKIDDIGSFSHYRLTYSLMWTLRFVPSIFGELYTFIRLCTQLFMSTDKFCTQKLFAPIGEWSQRHHISPINKRRLLFITSWKKRLFFGQSGTRRRHSLRRQRLWGDGEWPQHDPARNSPAGNILSHI